MLGNKTGVTVGLHFAGFDAENIKPVRAQLDDIAHSLGYISRSRSHAGQGNTAAMMVAIARGELKVVRPDESEERDTQIAQSA